MSLKFFGAVTTFQPEPALEPGYYPGGNPYDPNVIPMSAGAATGNQFPANIIRDDDATATIHQAYVGAGGNGVTAAANSAWVAGITKVQNYCKTNNVALMGIFMYQGDVGQSWSFAQTNIQALAPYLSGITSYLIILNEGVSTNPSAPITSTGSSPFSDLGTGGPLGLNGFIQFVKNIRSIVPSTCKLGINDFNICDQGSFTGAGKLNAAIALYQTCAANGAALDFVGAESYWMATNYSGYADPITAANAYWNGFGSATGVPIILSEFTPLSPNKGPIYWSQPNRQLDTWQGLVEAAAANQYVIGITGPWGGYRASTVWDGSSGEQCGGYGWMYNDTSGTPFASEAPNNDPNGTGSIGPGTVTSTLTWLQGWVPANVSGGGGSSSPLVQIKETVQTSTATSLTGQYNTATISGDLLVAGVATQGVTCTGVSDATNGSWTKAIGPIEFDSAHWIIYLFYKANAAANTPAVTAAWSGNVTSTSGVLVLTEYNSVMFNAILDTTGSASAHNATPSVSLTTTNASDQLVVFGATWNQFNGAGSGFTNRLLDIGNGIIWDDQLTSTTGSFTDAPPAGGSGQWSMIIAAFETLAPSPTGTTIPSSTRIVDNSLNVWTVSGGQVYQNGSLAGTTSNVIFLAYVGGTIYQENNVYNWYSWNGTTWVSTSSPYVVNGTSVPPATRLVDYNGNVWTLSGGQVYENGSLAGVTSGVTEIVYDFGVIYQFNGTNWWYWNGTTWVSSTSPLSGYTLAVTGTPPAAELAVGLDAQAGFVRVTGTIPSVVLSGNVVINALAGSALVTGTAPTVSFAVSGLSGAVSVFGSAPNIQAILPVPPPVMVPSTGYYVILDMAGAYLAIYLEPNINYGPTGRNLAILIVSGPYASYSAASLALTQYLASLQG